MVQTPQITATSVANEMAAYLGVTALSAPPGNPPMSQAEVIVLLSSDGFTAAEINDNLDLAMAIAWPN